MLLDLDLSQRHVKHGVECLRHSNTKLGGHALPDAREEESISGRCLVV